MITEQKKELCEIVRVLNILALNNCIVKVKSVALISLVDNPRNFEKLKAEKFISETLLASINKM